MRGVPGIAGRLALENPLMSFASWLRLLKTDATTATRRRPLHKARLVIDLLEDRFLPSTVFWTNPSGGDWDTGSNWSSGVTPGAGDNAQIGTLNPGSVVTHNGSQVDQFNSLVSQAPLVVAGGALSIASS